jgi:hypothetical protein
VEEKQSKHELREEVINKALPWAYFDGACKEILPKEVQEEFYISPPLTIYPSKWVLARKLITYVN